MYNKHMQFIRKTTLVVAATLFTVALFWFVALLGLQRTISSVVTIKDTLKDSGIYNTVIQDVLAQTQKDQKNQGANKEKELDIPVDDARVQAIIAQAFPPNYLQQQTEGVLDGTFAWLQGSAPKLSFTIDIADAKLRLADGLANYTREKAATLPPCPAGAPVAGDVDVFSATCLPAGVNPEIAATQARAQILQGDFLKDDRLSAETIKNDKGETLDKQLEQLPSAYQHAQDGVRGLAGLALLLGVAVVFLSVNWRAGIKKVAIISITVGALGILLSIMAKLLVDAASSNADLKQPLQHSMFKVAEGLIANARMWWLWTGLALVALGIVGLVALHTTKKDEKIQESEKIKLPVEDDTIGATSSKSDIPVASPKKHPKKLV